MPRALQGALTVAIPVLGARAGAAPTDYPRRPGAAPGADRINLIKGNQTGQPNVLGNPAQYQGCGDRALIPALGQDEQTLNGMIIVSVRAALRLRIICDDLVRHPVVRRPKLVPVLGIQRCSERDSHF